MPSLQLMVDAAIMTEEIEWKNKGSWAGMSCFETNTCKAFYDLDKSLLKCGNGHVIFGSFATGHLEKSCSKHR